MWNLVLTIYVIVGGGVYRETTKIEHIHSKIECNKMTERWLKQTPDYANMKFTAKCLEEA